MRRHKEVWKLKFNSIFISIPLSEMNGSLRVKVSSPPVEITYRTVAIFSWKKLAIDSVFPSSVYLFQKTLFVEWWKRCFRGSGKQNFLCCPTIVGKPLQNFLKIFSVDFTILWWYLEFLENKMSENPLNLCFYHHQIFSKVRE